MLAFSQVNGLGQMMDWFGQLDAMLASAGTDAVVAVAALAVILVVRHVARRSGSRTTAS